MTQDLESFDIPSSFWEHLEELRRTLIHIFIVIGIGIAVSLFFYQEIFHLITKPLKETQGHLQVHDVKQQRVFNRGTKDQVYTLISEKNTIVATSPNSQETSPGTYLIPPGEFLLIESSVEQPSLVIFSPLEGMVTTLKVCFWVGLVATSPLWLFLALQFGAPALRTRERHLLIPFLGLSLLFLALGVLLAFTVTIPLANQYLYAYNLDIGVNLWSFTHYLDYSIILLLANALAFEFALLLFFLVHLGVFTAEALAAKRRIMIVAAFIIGAVLTPPDVLTQFMLAIPLIIFYEAAILYARINKEAALPVIQDAAST